MVADVPYKNLKHTLLSLKIQVEDSLPFISNYIPKHIASPEELFYFLKDLTTYKSDPKGVELLQTVQTLMDRGGRGDCDCFTILVLTSCIYLNFSPQTVALVGKTKYSPSHIYSLVYDKKKKKMCSMDLTNPYYDTERSYKFKQTLPFMMTLRLEDNFFASKAGRAAKKNKRTVKKVVKKNARAAVKTTKAKRKVVRAENKTKRITSRQEGRTQRGDETRLKKLTGKQVKTGRKVKKLIRVKGNQDIIQARKDAALDRIQNRQHEDASDFEFEPGSDQIPETDWQATDPENEFDEFELLPEEENEEEYYEEEELNEGLSFFPGAVALVNKIGGKIKKVAADVKASKAGGAVQKGVSKYDEITSLKRVNVQLKNELNAEKKNKYIYGSGGAALGTLAGILIGRATK
jgi:hypothetical protein